MTTPNESYAPPPAEIPAGTALGAQVAEATQPEDTRPTVDFRGVTFTLRKRPSAKYMYLATKNPMDAIECIMPVPGDFQKLLDLDLDIEDLDPLGDAINAAYGLDGKGN